jgi:hypothetical protein
MGNSLPINLPIPALSNSLSTTVITAKLVKHYFNSLLGLSLSPSDGALAHAVG